MSGTIASRLRHVAEFSPSKSEVKGLPPDRPVQFLPMEAVSEFGDVDLSKTRPLKEVFDGYTYFRSGDVVIAKITPCFENGKGDLTLQATGTGELPGPNYTGTGASKDATERLSSIIEVINERVGTEFEAQDLVDGVTAQLVADTALQQAAQANDKGNFEVPFREALDDALVTRHAKHSDFVNKVFEDESIGNLFRGWMLDQVYAALSAAKDSVVS